MDQADVPCAKAHVEREGRGRDPDRPGRGRGPALLLLLRRSDTAGSFGLVLPAARGRRPRWRGLGGGGEQPSDRHPRGRQVDQGEEGGGGRGDQEGGGRGQEGEAVGGLGGVAGLAQGGDFHGGGGWGGMDGLVQRVSGGGGLAFQIL